MFAGELPKSDWTTPVCWSRVAEANVRCCADFQFTYPQSIGTQNAGTVVDPAHGYCKTDLTNVARKSIEDVAKAAANWTWTPHELPHNFSSNWTMVTDEKYRVADAGKTTVVSASLLVWCICTGWCIYMSRGACEKYYTQRKDKTRITKQRNTEQAAAEHASEAALTGDIEDQMEDHMRFAAADRTRRESFRLDPAEVRRLLGVHEVPRKWMRRGSAQALTPWPAECSLSYLPDTVKERILSFAGDASFLAKTCVVCKWWAELHTKAVRYVEATHVQWERPSAAVGQGASLVDVLQRYTSVQGIEIVAELPRLRHGLKPSFKPIDVKSAGADCDSASAQLHLRMWPCKVLCQQSVYPEFQHRKLCNAPAGRA